MFSFLTNKVSTSVRLNLLHKTVVTYKNGKECVAMMIPQWWFMILKQNVVEMKDSCICAKLDFKGVQKAKTNTNLSFFSRRMTNSAMIVVERLTNNVIATRAGEVFSSSH